jgi:Uma2 family endonuclease
MTITTQKLSLAEYLTYHDGTDNRYELVEGELKPMSLGNAQHTKVIRFLDREFEAEIQRFQRPWIALATLMGVQSPRGRRWDTVRIPDVLVMAAEQYDAMSAGAVIILAEPPPILVVEVVSPSTRTEDYRAKRIEYCVLDILEYWIVDLLAHSVTVCRWEEGSYTDEVFTGDAAIVSPTFPTWQLTAAQILAGKR